MKDPPVLLVGFCLFGLLLAIVDAPAQMTSGAPADADAEAVHRLASGAAIDIRTTLGFSETFRLNRWTPLSITLSNRGADLHGQLEVEVSGGNDFQGDSFTTLYRRELELPGQSRKRFHFTVFPESPTQPLNIRVVSAAGETLAQRQLDLRGHFTSARLLLVLSRDADLDYLNAAGGDSLRVLYPHPELLPDHWQGYDGVEALVIHGQSLENLSVRQFEALKMWLAHGGIIAIGAGPDYALLNTPRLAELVPATPVAITRTSTGTGFTAGGSASGSALEMQAGSFPNNFDVHRLTRLRGQVRSRAGELPLIIERDHGRGRVVYLTFDITRAPFAGWPGMRRLWHDSLRLPPPHPMTVATAQTRPADPVLEVIKKDRRSFPHHTSVFVFLALYLGILATGYRLSDGAGSGMLRRLRPWLTWAAPLLFAPAAYLLFGPLLFAKGANAVVLATIEPFTDSRYAALQIDLGLYSNRRPASAVASEHFLKLHYDGVEPVFRPLRRISPGALPSLTTTQSVERRENWLFYQDAGGLSLQPLDQREYVLHRITGRDIVVYELSGSVIQSERGLHLQLHNRSGRPLQHVRLVAGENIYALGTIAADADVDRILADSAMIQASDRSLQTFFIDTGADTGIETSIGNSGAADDLSAADRLIATAAFSDPLRRALTELREQPPGAGRSALITGFTASPLRPEGESAGWQHNGLALVLLWLPLTVAADDDGDGEYGG